MPLLLAEPRHSMCGIYACIDPLNGVSVEETLWLVWVFLVGHGGSEVHSRNAEAETLEILERYKSVGATMAATQYSCFTGRKATKSETCVCVWNLILPILPTRCSTRIHRRDPFTTRLVPTGPSVGIGSGRRTPPSSGSDPSERPGARSRTGRVEGRS